MAAGGGKEEEDIDNVGHVSKAILEGQATMVSKFEAVEKKLEEVPAMVSKFEAMEKKFEEVANLKETLEKMKGTSTNPSGKRTCSNIFNL